MKRYLLPVFIILEMVIGCRHAAPVSMGCVDLWAPDSCYAGDEMRLAVKSKAVDKGDAYIVIDDSRGLEVVKIKMGRDTFLIRRVEHSGTINIQSFVNSRLCNSKQVLVKPLQPIRPLAAYLGPKSVKTVGGDSTMITVIPMDRYGNLQPDTTMVSFTVIHPDKGIIKKTGRLYGGIAYLLISAEQLSGKGFATASTGEVATRQMDFLEVSGSAVNFRIHASVHSSFADGRQTFKVVSEKVSDANGNILPEGSIVYFHCADSRGNERTITGYTIGGIATVYLQNPAMPGVLKVNAYMTSGAESNVVMLEFSTPKFEY